MAVDPEYGKEPAFGAPASPGQPRALPSRPGAFGAPAGGLPQRSPWFGAGGEGVPQPIGDGGDDEGEPQYIEGAEPPAGGLDALGGIGALGEGLAGFGVEGEDPTGLSGAPAGAQPGQPGTAGLAQEELGGVSYDTPTTPGTGAQAEEAREQDELDVEFDKLNDQLLEGQENAKENIDAAFAKAQRRQASMLSLMGTSVSGREQGATAQTTLDYIQQLTNMYADFQNRSTELQLQWLDRKQAAKQRGIEAERQESLALIEYLLNSDQEIPEDLWQRAYGAEAGTAKGAVTGGGAAGGTGAAGATTGEPGSLKNEAGDFLMGPEGMGTSGVTQADPWDQEGESHQWFARYTGEKGQYEYYRLDEEGNEVSFNPGVDGGRWPGDPRLGRKVGHGWEGKPRAGGGGRWAADQGESWTQHEDSPYPVPEDTAVEFLDKMAARLGYDDHAHLYGQGVTGEWKTDYDNANLGGDQLGDVEYDSEGEFFRGDNQAVPAFIEVMQYISLFMAQNDGTEPTDDEIFDHLRGAGTLPAGVSGLTNPFTNVEL